MKNIPLDFCYKGNRDYVHGTDMFNKIKEILSQAFILSNLTHFRLVIHKQAKRNCHVLLGEKNQDVPPPQDYIANFSFNSGHQSFVGYIVEENRTIECRYPYDEEELNKRSLIEGNKIELQEDSPYSFIETIVGMTKLLHYTSYSSSGKWLFTRLDIEQFPDKEMTDHVCIELVKNFNNRLTKSKIIWDQTVIGSIYFSLVVKS